MRRGAVARRRDAACIVATVSTTIAMAWCSKASESGTTISKVKMPSAACSVTAAARTMAPATTGPVFTVRATLTA